MSISYALRKNELTNGSNQYAAMVKSIASVGTEEIVDRIMEQGSTVTRADVAAVIENLTTAIHSYVHEGFRVTMPDLVDVFASIRGNFTGELDSFDPTRHSVELQAVAGSRLKQLFKADASVMKVEPSSRTPHPLQFDDLTSGLTDQAIVAGGVGTLSGRRLDFNPAEADEGVFLMPAGGGEEVHVSLFQKNKPSELVFVTPDTLGAGTYILEVRKRFDSSLILKKGQLGASLECA